MRIPLLLLLAGCAAPATPRRGIEVRLTLLDPAPVVGSPLRIRLELVNHGPDAVVYDAQQAGVNRSLEVRAPNGAEVAYVYGSFQTMGALQELPPGARAVLVDRLDVAEQYNIIRPGRYTVRFRGDALSVSEPSAESDPAGAAAGPGSNAVAVEVGEGRLPDGLAIADHLLREIPEDWSLRRPRKEEPDVLAAFARTGGTKRETQSAVLRWEGPIPAPGRPVVGRIDGRSVVVEGSYEALADLLPSLRRALAAYRR